MSLGFPSLMTYRSSRSSSSGSCGQAGSRTR